MFEELRSALKDTRRDKELQGLAAYQKYEQDGQANDPVWQELRQQDQQAVRAGGQAACRVAATIPPRPAGPSGETREVNRERVLLLAWGRAVPCQLVHPLVAVGGPPSRPDRRRPYNARAGDDASAGVRRSRVKTNADKLGACALTPLASACRPPQPAYARGGRSGRHRSYTLLPESQAPLGVGTIADAGATTRGARLLEAWLASEPISLEGEGEGATARSGGEHAKTSTNRLG